MVLLVVSPIALDYVKFQSLLMCMLVQRERVTNSRLCSIVLKKLWRNR